MKYQVEIAPSAASDIEKAHAGISGFSEIAAHRGYQRVSAAILSLDTMPERFGRAAESDLLGVDLREMIFGKRAGRYRILFTVEGRRVHVQRVRHGAQDRLTVQDLQHLE